MVVLLRKLDKKTPPQLMVFEIEILLIMFDNQNYYI